MGRFRRHALLVAASLALGLLPRAALGDERITLKIGLPLSYQAQAGKLVDEGCTKGDERLCIRYRYAFGTDYQILEWLQNGKVDGAAVSHLTIELVRRQHEEKFGKASPGVPRAREFGRDFIFQTALPLNHVVPRRYRVSLRAFRGEQALPHPKRELHALYDTLLADRPAPPAAQIELRSHLSPDLPFLVADARNWLKTTRKPKNDEEESRLWDTLANALVERLRFSIFDDSRPALDASLKFLIAEEDTCGGELNPCLAPGERSDLFLMRRQAIPHELQLPASDTGRAPDHEAEFLAYVDSAAKRAWGTDTDLARFVQSNYGLETLGWRTRYRFVFTLEEMQKILGRVSARGVGEDDEYGIALVLTGGGVKAAYQTKLIDHLYSGRHLRNAVAPAQGPEPPGVPVKYVIGTSGGALLGIFVAAISDATKLNLSDQLWRQKGRPVADRPAAPTINSHTIFSSMDLLRWLSLLYCLLLFTVVCWVVLYFRRMPGRGLPEHERDEGSRFAPATLLWISLLLTTPWLIRFINGEHAAEHVPAIEGFVYLLLLLIAIYSDNSLVLLRKRRTNVKPRTLPVALMVVGALAVAFAIGQSMAIHAQPDFLRARMGITVPALAACAGTLVFFVGLQRMFERSAAHFHPLWRLETLKALMLLLSVCALTYILVLVLFWLDWTSVFELTLDFWKDLTVLALIVSVVLAVLAYWRGVPAALRDHLRPSFDFLLSTHPSRAANTPRYFRIFATLAIGWGWWNVAVAPGVYGNKHAFDYFQGVVRSVFSNGPALTQAEERAGQEIEFRAYYAAPITSLQKRMERYVLFHPGRAPAREESESRAFARYRSWLSITNDPRWLEIEKADEQRELLTRIAFASGSPFPVFPAHRIELPGIGPELLVDGGYAHNIPVEAAKRLGARRVLVIHSSPRQPLAPRASAPPDFPLVGNLTWMLRWLVPYFYERSQVQDLLSAEDIVVASLAPSAKPEAWPILTDFRSRVIERMFSESEKDRTRRIAAVESWGNPLFRRAPAKPPAR